MNKKGKNILKVKLNPKTKVDVLENSTQRAMTYGDWTRALKNSEGAIEKIFITGYTKRRSEREDESSGYYIYSRKVEMVQNGLNREDKEAGQSLDEGIPL